MKILLIAVGTRGDIEPFLAIAEILHKKGHKVICCFPEQFKKIDNTYEFIGLNSKFLELLDSNEGKIVMGGKATILKKAKAYYKIYKQGKEINKLLCKEQNEIIKKEQPDKIIYHIKASYPLIFETNNPNKTILVSPIPYIIHPVFNHPHIGFNFNLGSYISRLTYKLANYGLIKNIQSVSSSFFDEKVITTKKIKEALYSCKMFYTISPSLFNQPNYWDNNIKVIGYHERNKTINWKPTTELLNFIKKHKRIVFVTFGSMVNNAPIQKTKLIIKVMENLEVPAIINTSSGGLMEPKEYNSNLFYFVSDIPYEWVLPQVYAVIHHGGSGTTHMAIKYACPSLIIPHIIDQFLWDDVNSNKRLGPKGIKISRISEKNLTKKIIDLTSNPLYKENTLEISEKMKNEKFEELLYQSIIK